MYLFLIVIFEVNSARLRAVLARQAPCWWCRGPDRSHGLDSANCEHLLSPFKVEEVPWGTSRENQNALTQCRAQMCSLSAGRLTRQTGRAVYSSL